MKLINKLEDHRFLLKAISIFTIAIMFVPMLYSFTFLGAFWNPYGNLNKVSSIAFVNLDKPVYKNSKKYNVGQQLENKLKNNNDFKWKFVDYNTAKDGVENTSYYAMIVIPKDFSKKISDSIVDGNFKKPNIIYEGNAGRNYIFSLLTKKGAETIKTQIEQSITKETAKVLVDNLYDIKKSTKTAADSANQLADGSNTALDGSKQLNNGLLTAKTGVLSAQTSISQIEPQLNSHKGLLSLLTVQNANSMRTMLNDADTLNNSNNGLDLLGMKKTLNSLTPANIAAMNNTIADFNSVNLSDLSKIDPNKINSLTNDINNIYPALNYLSCNSGKLQQIGSNIQNINVSKMRTVLNGSESLSGVINNIDVNSINSLNQLLNDQNSMLKLNNILNTYNKTFSGDSGKNLINFLSTEKNLQNNINSILSDNKLSNDQKISSMESMFKNLSDKGLTPTNVNSTIDSISTTVTNMNSNSGVISSIEPLLSQDNINLLKTLTSTDAQKEVLLLKTSLSSDNIKTASNMLDQISDAQNTLKDPSVQKMMAYIPNLQSDLNNNQSNLIAIQSLLAKNGGAAGSIDKINKLQNETKSAQSTLTTIENTLNDPAMQAQLKNAPRTLDQVAKLKNEVNNNQKLLSVAKDYLDDGDITMANNLISEVPSMVDKFNQLSSGISQLSDGSSKLNSGLSALNDGNNKFKDALNSSYKDLNKNLKFSSNKFSKYLSAPINLKDISINNVKNYGEGLAPYFISLSLWLGALFVNAIISIAGLLGLFKKKYNNSAVIKYTLGIILVAVQALILTLSLRTGLGLSSVNTAGLYLNNIFTACVYFSVMFGLSQGFGLMATPICFVLLIMQLSSCAGTFPIETAYKFYQVIGRVLPMTYTVKTTRMIISGMDGRLFLQNFTILLTFAVATLVCGTLMGKLIKHLKRKSISKEAESAAA